MLSCPTCGHDLVETLNFCPHCGTSLAKLSGDTTRVIAPVVEEFRPEDLPDADADAIAALPAGSALLIVLRGGHADGRFLIDSDVVTAGRHPRCDIFLDDITVSRHHARFTRRDGKVWVSDENSLNGTYVNKNLVEQELALQSGDEVQIGKYRMVFFSGAGLMALGLRSIGQVLAVLKPEFEDISISKIRFLESEGLISPERAPSGYRRYAESDIERLRYILDVQKNHYLPLKVIREHLDMMDRGQQPPALTASSGTSNEADALEQANALAPRPAPPKRAIRVTRRELLELSGLTDAALNELEKHQLVIPRRGTIYYGRDALTVAVIARKLAAFGLDARHLRVVKQAAEREVGLIEQAIAPHLRRSPTSRALPAEVMQLVLHAHAAIMRSQMPQ